MIKVGDRVKVYGNTDRVVSDMQLAGNPPAFRRGEKGTIDIVNPGMNGAELVVELDKGGFVDVHEKQVRKLKPKKVREIYVNYYHDGHGNISKTVHNNKAASVVPGKWIIETVKFREVKND